MRILLPIVIINVLACGKSLTLEGGRSVTPDRSSYMNGKQTQFIDPIEPIQQDTNVRLPPNPKIEEAPPSSTNNCLRGGSSVKGKGPYSVASTREFSGYTVFYPREMQSENCKFPWIVWGNGTTQRGIGYYGGWDQHLASWGIVVIHSHADGGGGLSGAGPMKGGVDVAKRLASGSMRGKLTEKGGVAGHSQGGIGAHVTAAARQEIAAVVDLQGGGMARHSKPSLLLTGSRDFMKSSVNSAYGMLQGPALYYSYSGSDHIMAPNSNVNYRASAAQFFRWALANDQAAKKSFVDCVFCQGADVKAKNF